MSVEIFQQNKNINTNDKTKLQEFILRHSVK